jgi:hypothetical protein
MLIADKGLSGLPIGRHLGDYSGRDSAAGLLLREVQDFAHSVEGVSS